MFFSKPKLFLLKIKTSISFTAFRGSTAGWACSFRACLGHGLILLFGTVSLISQCYCQGQRAALCLLLLRCFWVLREMGEVRTASSSYSLRGISFSGFFRVRLEPQCSGSCLLRRWSSPVPALLLIGLCLGLRPSTARRRCASHFGRLLELRKSPQTLGMHGFCRRLRLPNRMYRVEALGAIC